jgi:hypothetical protein
MPDIQIKRGLASALAATNPVVNSGEPIFATDTLQLKIGDGVTAYANIPVVGSGTFLQLSGGTLTGTIIAPSGSFTNNIAIGSNNITPTNVTNMINSANLYLWSNFR